MRFRGSARLCVAGQRVDLTILVKVTPVSSAGSAKKSNLLTPSNRIKLNTRGSRGSGGTVTTSGKRIVRLVSDTRHQPTPNDSDSHIPDARKVTTSPVSLRLHFPGSMAFLYTRSAPSLKARNTLFRPSLKASCDSLKASLAICRFDALPPKNAATASVKTRMAFKLNCHHRRLSRESGMGLSNS